MWTFIQTGSLLTPSGDPASHTWYSGHDEHANKPEDEGLAGLGPLPRGTYTFAKEVVADSHMGPFAFKLIPDVATRAHIISLNRGPDSFYAHAGNREHTHSASAGCMVCEDGVDPVKNLWSSLDRTLKCISGLESANPII